MPKQEAALRREFHRSLKLYLPSYKLVSVQDIRTSGTPDDNINGNGRSTWWELKHATPRFDDSGIQLLTCMQLAATSFCRYIIWWESASGLGKKTMIVHPNKVREARDAGRWLFEPEEVVPGFDMRFLVAYVRTVHEQSNPR